MLCAWGLKLLWLLNEGKNILCGLYDAQYPVVYAMAECCFLIVGLPPRVSCLLVGGGRRCLPCYSGGCGATYLTSMLWHSSGIDGLKWAGDSIDSVGPCVMLMDLWVSRGSSWLVDMNSVTSYGNIGGPVELQRRVSPPSHCRFQRQTYTLECDLRERLIDQSSLIYRKRMWKDHVDA